MENKSLLCLSTYIKIINFLISYQCFPNCSMRTPWDPQVYQSKYIVEMVMDEKQLRIETFN